MGRSSFPFCTIFPFSLCREAASRKGFPLIALQERGGFKHSTAKTVQFDSFTISPHAVAMPFSLEVASISVAESLDTSAAGPSVIRKSGAAETSKWKPSSTHSQRRRAGRSRTISDAPLQQLAWSERTGETQT